MNVSDIFHWVVDFLNQSNAQERLNERQELADETLTQRLGGNVYVHYCPIKDLEIFGKLL